MTINAKRHYIHPNQKQCCTCYIIGDEDPEEISEPLFFDLDLLCRGETHKVVIRYFPAGTKIDPDTCIYRDRE